MTPFQQKLHFAAVDCELRGYTAMADCFRKMLAVEIAEFGLDGEQRELASVVLSSALRGIEMIDHLAILRDAEHKRKVHGEERQKHMETTVSYRNQIPVALANGLAQTEAAALAVLAASKRRDMDDNREKQASAVPNPHDQALYDWWLELENVCIKSIQANDGNVVHWIGVAAKQMNPLLS